LRIPQWTVIDCGGRNDSLFPIRATFRFVEICDPRPPLNPPRTGVPRRIPNSLRREYGSNPDGGTRDRPSPGLIPWGLAGRTDTALNVGGKATPPMATVAVGSSPMRPHVPVRFHEASTRWGTFNPGCMGGGVMAGSTPAPDAWNTVRRVAPHDRASAHVTADVRTPVATPAGARRGSRPGFDSPGECFAVASRTTRTARDQAVAAWRGGCAHATR
jgi:hypothetical protein